MRSDSKGDKAPQPFSATSTRPDLASFRRPREERTISPERGLPTLRRTRSCPDMPTRGIAFHDRLVWTKLELRVLRTLTAALRKDACGSETTSSRSAGEPWVPKPRFPLSGERIWSVGRDIDAQLSLHGIRLRDDVEGLVIDHDVPNLELAEDINDLRIKCAVLARTNTSWQSEADPLLAEILRDYSEMLGVIRSHVLRLTEHWPDTQSLRNLIIRSYWVKRKLSRRFYVNLHYLTPDALADEDEMESIQAEQRECERLFDKV